MMSNGNVKEMVKSIGSNGNGATHPTSWIATRDTSPVPTGTTEKQWREWGRVLADSATIVSWKVARWIHYGNKFHLTCDEIAAILQVPSPTVRKARHVANIAFDLMDAYPQMARLPFAAFSAVAAKSLPHDFRVATLLEAVEKGLSVQAIFTRQADWLAKINRPTSNTRGRKIVSSWSGDISRPQSGIVRDGKVAIFITEDAWRKLCVLARSNGKHRTGTALVRAWIEDGWVAMFPEAPDEMDEDESVGAYEEQ